MSYQVIARKWRPNTFEEVTGQEAITKTLRNAVEHDRLHHAYLFSGARGVGKTTTARLLAKALNCHKTSKPNPTPCSPTDENACASCVEIAESRSIDVMEFDAASNTQVEKIRELIIESININPARDRYKIFIIDEVHMLSNSSFNALLKTLEEPPPNVQFIMATTELHKVPATISSRCQEFQFRTISLQKIFDRLKLIAEAENINISDEALREIARSGEGSMRDAQSNLDQVISFSGETIEINDVVAALGIASAEMLSKTAKAIAENKPADALKIVDELISRGQDLRNFCRDLLSFFRDLLIFKMASDAENLLDTAVLSKEELAENAAPFSESDLIRFFNSLAETEAKLREAREPRYVLELGLIKLVEMRRLVPIETILERLSKLESKLENTDSEKKTLKIEPERKHIDFPEKEGRYPIKITEDSKFNTQELWKNVEKSETKPTDIFSERSQKANKKPGEAQLKKGNSLNTTDAIGKLKSPEFLESIPIKLPPISAEELEHIEDKNLDEMYETHLARLGDNLLPLRNASKIVEASLGTLQTSHAQSESKNPKTGVAPAFDISAYMPAETESDETELPVLSENPTEEEMLAYAKAHPLVKKTLRLFRGKILKVELLQK